jgi:hypothetical protein
MPYKKGAPWRRTSGVSRRGTKSIIEARINTARVPAATFAFPIPGHDIGNGIWTRIRACWLNNVALRPAYIANIEMTENTVKQAVISWRYR